MTRDDFRADLLESKKILEDVSGTRVIGYRAPSFSINEDNTWVYDELREAGFIYSSSTYPIEHDLYGVPSWPRFKNVRPEGIVEIPIPTLNVKDRNVGIGGGGYFRLYPYWLSRNRIRKYMDEESHPYNFYFHPWEIDPNQPKVSGASLRSKFRHYMNLSRMEGKLDRLTDDFSWTTMAKAYDIKG